MAVNEGVLQCSYVYTLDGKTYTNQTHYKQSPSDPSAQNLTAYLASHGTALVNLWKDEMEPLLSSSVTLTELQLKYFGQTRLLPEIPPAPVGTPRTIQFQVVEEAVFTTGLPSTGNVADQFLPGFNSFRARKITATPGRRGRGHNSIAGVPESGSDGNILATGDWTTWQTNAPSFLGASYTFADDLFDYVMLPVVLSLTAAQAAGVAFIWSSVYAPQIISVIPNRLIGTMRRRKRKVI